MMLAGGCWQSSQSQEKAIKSAVVPSSPWSFCIVNFQEQKPSQILAHASIMRHVVNYAIREYDNVFFYFSRPHFFFISAYNFYAEKQIK